MSELRFRVIDTMDGRPHPPRAPSRYRGLDPGHVLERRSGAARDCSARSLTERKAAALKTQPLVIGIHGAEQSARGNAAEYRFSSRHFAELFRPTAGEQ